MDNILSNMKDDKNKLRNIQYFIEEKLFFRRS